ncbi:MAG: NAD-dependent epimerase/dehydratase family protein [Myxococcota bacterium]|nr:NAD-dependent epimerase/dehydratase family protein [Myxococcota bacterium]
MRLLVTGASSFVGAHFCREAALRHAVYGVFHQTPLSLSGVTPLRCDLRHPAAIDRLGSVEPDVVVHMACKVMGNGIETVNRRMMDVVLGLGVPVLYASSTMVHWDADTAYARSRREDEERLADSGLPHAILRPCAPYGPRLKEHKPRHPDCFQRLADWIVRWPCVPVIGDGSTLRQPVHVVDFCRAALALIEQGLSNLAFDAGGPRAIRMDHLVDVVARAVSRDVQRLHVPTALFQLGARFTGGFEPELLEAFSCDDIVDPVPLMEATGVVPRPFSEGARDLR